MSGAEILLELSTAAHFASYDDLLSTILTLDFSNTNPSATSTSTSTTTTSRDDDVKDRPATDPPHQLPTSHPQQQRQHKRRLPKELGERVAHYLVIQRVDMAHVKATGCSSQQQLPSHEADNESSIRPAMPLSECLVDSDTSWWISQDSVEVEPQYVEFTLVSDGNSNSNSSNGNNNHTQSACRLSAVAIRIPPLPMGPLSVREFRLDTVAHVTATNGTGTDTSTSDASPSCITTESWSPTHTAVFEVENRTGWQRFVLPNGGVDVSRVRVVCLSNQFGYLNLPPSRQRRRTTTTTAPYAQVGFYCVQFE
jgi:hypothetical protein